MKRIFILLLSLFAILLCSCDFQAESSSTGTEGDSNITQSEFESQSESQSTSETPKAPVTVEYKAGEGGKIEGITTQTVNSGEKASAIRAVPEAGYRFVSWDDGSKTAIRVDAPSESKTYTAIFTRVYTVKFLCDDIGGRISGSAYQNVDEGKQSTVVYAVAKPGYKFISWDNGETSSELQVTPTENMTLTAIFEKETLAFPVLSINTKDGASIVSKEEYLNCYISVENALEGFNLDNNTGKIRGRGNTSFEIDKKSYKIKFDDPTNLFGNGSAKDWTLISNHFDLSLIRNYLAYSVASEFSELSSTSKTQFVDLYINGEYEGVYLVCEQVEIHENRVNITEGSYDVDTGYLIELDGRLDGAGFYVFGDYHSIKAPDSKDGELTEEQLSFIQSHINKCFNTILYKEYAEVEALIDTKSFAQAYIVFELFNCVDVGFSSFYMYKDAGGKLQCGPVWDFDRSVGNVRNNEDARRYDSLWARQDNIWFAALLGHDEFYQLVCETLKEYLPTIKQTLSDCYAYIYEREESFNRNFERWKILGTWVWPNPDELIEMESWREQVDFVKDYLEKSLAFMCEQYPGSE